MMGTQSIKPGASSMGKITIGNLAMAKTVAELVDQINILKSQKAALLAACKLAIKDVGFHKTEKLCHIPPKALTPQAVWAIKSAIEQMEEVT